VTTSRPVTFRAGRRAGVQAEAAATHLLAGAYVLMADISEFEPSIADAAYLAWSKAVIIRAMYGADHTDGAWYGGQRRAQLHAGGAQFLGIYQYVTAAQDAAAQARALARLLGHLTPGEYVIADIEEGAGSQQARWQAWAQVIHGELGFAPGDYSGLDFAAAAGLQPVDWVAAYRSAEPTVPHKLWQFTDSWPVPGVGTADCSVFRGTIGQLRALAYAGAPPPAPDWTDIMIASLPDLHPGDADHPGAIQYVHRMQALIAVIGRINNLPAAAAVTADGTFGTATGEGLAAIQHMFGVPFDPACRQPTWAALVAGQRP
jgi:peptidoglycan hydrolase-like protein with peptidoglycan-binding domain